mmetsp:Transcript_22550/g.21674  ORF Transcript_22550/g.21674 Transcript_22550/m.21674 type:complete len:121 (+) Transcript_22550:1107-1469(+)
MEYCSEHEQYDHKRDCEDFEIHQNTIQTTGKYTKANEQTSQKEDKLDEGHHNKNRHDLSIVPNTNNQPLMGYEGNNKDNQELTHIDPIDRVRSPVRKDTKTSVGNYLHQFSEKEPNSTDV